MKITYNKHGDTTHELEHEGITFRFCNEAVVDALQQQSVDILRYTYGQIETLVRHARNNGLSLDFSVKRRITKDFVDDGIIHSFEVIKIPRLKD